jgi:hypothetical protein
MGDISNSKTKLAKVLENSKKLFGENHGITQRASEEV